MKFKKKVWFGVVASILFILALFITCIDMLSFHIEFYEYEFQNLGTAEFMNMDEDDLSDAMEVLLDYIVGDVDNIDVKYKVGGVTRSMYSEDEISHMVDVKDLYDTAIIVRNGAAVGFLFLLLIIFVDNRKELLEVMSNAYIKTFTCFLFGLSALLLYAYIDFTKVWTIFHQLVFTNELWLMDINNSLMIQMLQEKVFYDLVFLVFASFATITLSLYAFSFIYKRRLRKRIMKLEENKE